jgi:hypothetical protein
MFRSCLLALGAMGAMSMSSLAQDPAESDEQGEEPLFAFLVFEETPSPDEADVRAALTRHLPDAATVSDIEIDEKTISISMGDQSAIIGLIDAPIPWEDLEGPCATSWLWDEATDVMKAHQGHALILVQGHSQLDGCVQLTKIMAAATEFLNATGVYWGHGSVVLPPDQWRDLAKDASVEEPPLLAWIEFRVQTSADGKFSVLTTGLDYFDCMEIEIIDSTHSIEEVLNLAMGVAYITIKGEQIPDGDTVGPDDETKIFARHRDSVWDREEKVLQLED